VTAKRRPKKPPPRQEPTALERQAGERARSIREGLDLTQAEVAEKAGVSIKSVGAFELGVRGVSFDMLDAIAKALGVAPEVLLFDSNAAPPAGWLARKLLETAGPAGAIEAVVRAMARKRLAVECLASALLTEAGPSAAMESLGHALKGLGKVDSKGG
jgi:transcriptional regulator with XRE-family HTH domain